MLSAPQATVGLAIIASPTFCAIVGLIAGWNRRNAEDKMKPQRSRTGEVAPERIETPDSSLEAGHKSRWLELGEMMTDRWLAEVEGASVARYAT